MLRFPVGKLHNAYIIETHNYESTKKAIFDLAISHGFDKNLVYSGNHPDITILESEDGKFSISSLRDEVIESSYYSPKVIDKKFYIIYDAVYLTHQMQNAMLKTLEEPPIYDTFFLLTSNQASLLDTVKSRAMILIDEDRDNFEDILSFNLTDDAIEQLTNIKYESETSKMLFSDNFLKREDRFKSLIKLYRCVLRDVLLYKKTLSKDFINIREKEMEIVSIANSLSFEDLGYLVDMLDDLSKYKGYQIDKKVAVFNFLSGGKNGKVLGNTF